MRVLERNKEHLWYANPTGTTYVTDSNGLKTGEKQITYGTPEKVRMSMAISSGANSLSSQGMVELTSYGLQASYTHKAVTEDLSCPMNEESFVWYKIEPTKIVDGQIVNVHHNFKVVRKSKSLNHIIYYLKEVDVQ